MKQFVFNQLAFDVLHVLDELLQTAYGTLQNSVRQSKYGRFNTTRLQFAQYTVVCTSQKSVAVNQAATNFTYWFTAYICVSVQVHILHMTCGCVKSGVVLVKVLT